MINRIKRRIKKLIEKSSIKRVIIFGILLRIVIMPITGHWDLTSLNDVASSLVKNNFLYKDFYYNNIAIYPPFTYWLLAIWQIIIRPLVSSDFYNWLQEPELNAFYNPHVFRYFFLLKIPHLLFDIGILILLLKLFPEKKNRKILAVFWALNPVVLYATFAWGAVGIIPTFFLLLAVFLIKRKRAWIGLPMLGIGGGFKLFPLLFIIPAALMSFKSWNKRILGIIAGLLPFVLGISYYLNHQGFISNVFQSDRSNMIYHISFYIGYLESIYLFFVFYTFILFWIKEYASGKLNKIWQYVLIIFLFMYATAAFTPQWAVWVMPFLIIAFIKFKNLRKNYIWLLVAYLLVILTFDQHLSFGLFSPIEPSLLVMPAFDQIIGRFVQEPVKIWSLFRSFFAGTILWFSYSWWKTKNYEQDF